MSFLESRRPSLAGTAGATLSNAVEETPSPPLLQLAASSAAVASQQQGALAELDSMRTSTAARNSEAESYVSTTRQVGSRGTAEGCGSLAQGFRGLS
jgi:hypothetical protein